MDQATASATTSFDFGPFRYDAARRELRDANGPVRAGSRALELLGVLLENPGRLFSREELVARVWPSTVVEETSLRVHISGLRRLLGDGQDGARYIANVPGRGYIFVGEVKPSAAGLEESAPAAEPSRRADVRRDPPASLTRTVGRGQDIAKLVELLSRERLVCIVGAGGMGKTTAAWAVAENRSVMHGQRAIFVDLSTISDGSQVVVEVAQSCGLNVARGEIWDTLQTAMRDQHVLVILDNCEHVIQAAAALADRLLRQCLNMRILATSREPLEAEGEWVFRLPPLGLPDDVTALSAEELLNYPAIRLFVDRAQAACSTFDLSEANVSAVRQICGFLDGMPLAIELAAARMDTLGAQGLLLRLESALELLTRGRRTARARHQTLHAVMNWSYQLLTETEKVVLKRLSVFRSAFELEAAVAVAAGPGVPPGRVMEDVLGLCEKSLLMIEAVDGSAARHRLPHITRLFAERELELSADAGQVHRQHAAFVLAALRKMNRAQEHMPNFRSNLTREPLVAEMRAAVAWALIDENDLPLGIEIMAESVWVHLAANLMHEARVRLQMAIEKMARAGVEGSMLEFKLKRSLTFLASQVPISADHLDHALASSTDLPARFESVEDKIEALYAVSTSAYGHGQFIQSLTACDEVRELAQGELAVLSVALGDRLAALNLHALGQHDAAERLAHRVMRVDNNTLQRRFQSTIPYPVSMRIQLARIHWLRGDLQRAWVTAQEAIALDDGGHYHGKCHVFGMAAIPIAIWKGDLATAARWTRELRERSNDANLPYWQAFAKLYAHLQERDEHAPPEDDDAQMRDAPVLLMDIYATLKTSPPHARTLDRVRNGEVGWCAPEVLRLAALAALDRDDADSMARCETALRAAYELSLEQGARFWALRIAVSLCELASPGGEAFATGKSWLLAQLQAIDDGSAQPDLQRARRLLL